MNSRSSTSSRAKVLFDVGSNLLLAQLEREKNDFRIKSKQVGAITRMLRKVAHDELRPFHTPKSRDDFLYAATDYLSSLDGHEELIVGIGTRRGPSRSAGSRLTHVYRAVGDRESVRFPPRFIEVLRAQAQRVRGDLIVMHNHPRALWKTAVGDLFGTWRPVASTADRTAATRHLVSRLPQLLRSEAPSSVRWYLVD